MEIGFDYETTSPKRGRTFMVTEAKVVGYSVSSKAGNAYYVGEAPPAQVFNHTLVAHNAKFEYIHSLKLGHEMQQFEDTKLAAYLLGYPSSNLKHLTHQLLGIKPITYDEVTQGRDMGDIPPEEIVDYGAADADHTLQLWPILRDEMDRMGVREVYERVEKPLLPILSQAQLRGVQIDTEAAQRALDYFMRRASSAARRAVREGLPASVSIGSTEQLARWLESVHAPIKERTEEKQLLKTDSNTLKEVEWWKPSLIQAILKYREFIKLASFPAKFLLLSVGGILHPDINQAGHFEEVFNSSSEAPATGRLSMSNPNLQQLPHHGRGKDKEYSLYGNLIRRCIKARPGYTLVAADIAQQEPRITAYVADEPAMQADFASGIPIYAPMGELLYGRPIDKRNDEPEWHTAKTYFLAYVYGCDYTKLLEIDQRFTEKEARRASAAFDRRYLGLAKFREAVRLEISKYGFARDWFGRVRHFPGAFSGQERDRDAALREAINFKIQGPGASLIKLGITNLEPKLADFDAHFLLSIHDEVIYEVREDQVDRFLELVYPMFNDIMPVEFPAEPQVGKNLGEMNEPSRRSETGIDGLHHEDANPRRQERVARTG